MFFEDNIDHAKYSGHLYGLGTSFIVNGTNFHESNGEANSASWFILMKNAVVHDKKFEQVAGAGTSVAVPAEGKIWTDIHNNVKSKNQKDTNTKPSPIKLLQYTRKTKSLSM